MFAFENQRLRRLAIYPECAVIRDEAEKKVCCDGKVQSTAGRQFCYNEVEFPEGTFDVCNTIAKDSHVQLYNCCDQFANGNRSVIFDCMTAIQPDVAKRCTTIEECEALLASEVEPEAPQPTEDETEQPEVEGGETEQPEPDDVESTEPVV